MIKKFFKFFFSRTLIIGLLLAAQLAFLLVSIFYLSDMAGYLYILFTVISLGVVVYLVSKDDNPSYKLAWVIPILAFPLFGGLLYLFFGNKHLSLPQRRRLEDYREDTRLLAGHSSGLEDELRQHNPFLALQANFINTTSSFPVYKATDAQYLPLGERFHEKLLEELEKAERFILMEYFIVEPGRMWDPVLEVLKRKAAQGVEILFMYDDFGCMQLLPHNFRKELEACGIKVTVFNPFVAWLNVAMNNRDHRKIAIIDGNVGFCGGLNLADEYINAKQIHGHWKDTAVMITGDAVWNLTLMFFQVWKFYNRSHEDVARYCPTITVPDAAGYVQPFSDNPFDNINVSENTFLQAINHATHYIYITTPYLIIDNELATALKIAAQSGVDVRIITPHIPDKWYVHTLTQSFYPQLVEAGVKIYEYTPGFIHAKMFVSDDQLGMVGTINMDYRSLYLHFECGIMFYQHPVIEDIRDDILRCIGISEQIDDAFFKRTHFPKRLAAAILRLFAPLM